MKRKEDISRILRLIFGTADSLLRDRNVPKSFEYETMVKSGLFETLREILEEHFKLKERKSDGNPEL